jgi:amino-acid N-acetyltransferase
MSLMPVQRGSSTFAAFEGALMAAGLPIADLDADGAQYFAFGHQTNEPLAFVGLISFGDEGLLRSLVVPITLRGENIGNWAIDAMAQKARQQGIRRIWLLTTDAERYFIRQGFRIVHRKDVPAVIAASRQFSTTCPDSAVLMCLTLV